MHQGLEMSQRNVTKPEREQQFHVTSKKHIILSAGSHKLLSGRKQGERAIYMLIIQVYSSENFGNFLGLHRKLLRGYVARTRKMFLNTNVTRCEMVIRHPYAAYIFC
ncbi:uncharacterized protein LOC106137663 [Amyelois transitella]|uniref:uncharacterized protein LOC106137663 n=1 Tax=Amyelois transitella TaxID=680683 RepID=UPI00067D9CFD|nr:uncharacterized protein LOC106137663 [Amyelois transitella]